MTFSALMSRRRWRRLAKGLCVLGGCLFFGSLIAHLFVAGYYAGHRPLTPQPALGRSVRLLWTYPITYGSAADASTLQAFSDAGIYAAAIFAVGWAIRIYILDEDFPIRGTPRYGRWKREQPDE
jgi:hypothetical protein